MLTVEKFVSTLEAWYLRDNTSGWHSTYDLWAWGNFSSYLNSPVQVDNLRFELVDNKDTGTREDFTDGEPVYDVVSVTDVATDETVYFRRDGVVQSWDGDEMGEWHRVTPSQKTITVYE